MSIDDTIEENIKKFGMSKVYLDYDRTKYKLTKATTIITHKVEGYGSGRKFYTNNQTMNEYAFAGAVEKSDHVNLTSEQFNHIGYITRNRNTHLEVEDEESSDDDCPCCKRELEWYGSYTSTHDECYEYRIQYLEKI